MTHDWKVYIEVGVVVGRANRGLDIRCAKYATVPDDIDPQDVKCGKCGQRAANAFGTDCLGGNVQATNVNPANL